MPITNTWEENGVLLILKGRISALELHESNRKIMEDPRALTAKYQLVDATEAIDLEMDELIMVDIAVDDAAFSRKVRNVKVAMIVDNPEFRKIAEKYILLSWKLNSSWQFRIYETEREAREWLELDIHQPLT